ncbi:MAG: DNA polymerase III subunit epsilon [Alphaproteobacteria bacterium]|nr:MAG: DNA polymerase III subunit epsilon [Alphaproteobacteria bacterium]
MREIVLDTETTGLDPENGHRIIEIGCIELLNHVPSDRVFHCYLNPQRSVPAAAVEIHGLTDALLADKPVFSDVVDDFVAFIDKAPLVIHNASFDMGFLNAELRRTDRPELLPERAIDTLVMARRKFPGSPNSLDALCRRFEISTESRHKHGALVDAALLAEVYLELIGGRQPGLVFEQTEGNGAAEESRAGLLRSRPRPLPPRVTPEEKIAHERFIEQIIGPGALWRG